jgi:hypothetical protein
MGRRQPPRSIPTTLPRTSDDLEATSNSSLAMFSRHLAWAPRGTHTLKFVDYTTDVLFRLSAPSHMETSYQSTHDLNHPRLKGMKTIFFSSVCN